MRLVSKEGYSNNKMIVTIHQPNFFPWLPFYEKIRAADVFVLLRHCQFEKNNYQNRFNYRDKWHTMSINRGLEPIIDKRYMSHVADWNKIKANLRDKKRILDEYDHCISESMYQTNHDIIMTTLKKLEIATKIEYDTPTDLLSTDRLVEICKTFGADTYLAGSGGKNYMDLDKFKAAGIDVRFQTLSDEQRVHTLDIL